MISIAVTNTPSRLFHPLISFCSPFLRTRLLTSLLLSLLALSGCSSDGNDDADGFVLEPAALQGAAIDGPLINASVTVYILDSAATDLKGRQIASGATDEQAHIVDVTIDEVELVNGPFLVEITGGEDLTTQTTPVIPTLRTVVGAKQLALIPEAVYATPLSTLALEYARLHLASNPDSNWVSSLKESQTVVRNMFGLGLLGDTDLITPPSLAAPTTDLFNTAPFMTSDGNAEEALNYLKAIETFTAVINQLKQSPAAANTSIDELLLLVAADMQDGHINGDPVSILSAVTELSTTIETPPANIAGTNKPLADILAVFIADSAIVSPDTPASASLQEPTAGTAKPGLDSDGDGAIDALDYCPEDASGTTVANCPGDNTGGICVSVAVAGTMSGFDTGTLTGSGTGSFDEATGILSWTETTQTTSGFTDFKMDISSDFDTAADTGTAAISDCYDDNGAIAACGSVDIGVPGPIPVTANTVGADGSGTISSSSSVEAIPGSFINVDTVYSFTVEPCSSAVAVTVSVTGVMSGFDTGTLSGSGTGSFDEATGILSWTETTQTASGFTDFKMDISSSFDTAADTGTAAINDCYDDNGAIAACGSVVIGVPGPIPVTANTIGADGSGTISTSSSVEAIPGSFINVDTTYTFTVD